MKKALYVLLVLLAVIFLLYLLVPGPRSIDDFGPLPDSSKSTLSGDTVQVPNVSAYFSDNYRDVVIPFYIKSYTKSAKLPFSLVRLNYPPEFAYIAIKDQTQSTYLEELVFPMRESLFINGLEPFEKSGEPRYEGAIPFEVGGNDYLTKVTLRYHPSPIWARIVVWAGVLVSVYLLWKMTRRIISNA